MRPNFLARPASTTSGFLVLRLVSVHCVSALSRPSGAPWCISAPPVRGVLRLVQDTRKCFFAETSYFFKKGHFPSKNIVLGNHISPTQGHFDTKLRALTHMAHGCTATGWVIPRPIHQTVHRLTATRAESWMNRDSGRFPIPEKV